MKNFFNLLETSNSSVKYIFKCSSRILMKNIYLNWLSYLHGKTQKHMIVYLDNKSNKFSNKHLPYSTLKVQLPVYSDETILNHNLDHWAPDNDTQLEFSIVLPHQDFMQYFIKWQQYRKFWWSSVTTTPSLFKIDDIHQENGEAKVNIVAQFPFGLLPVEHLTVTTTGNCKELENNSLLKCTMSLESALFILLFDGCANNIKEEYLRLHRKMSPYKFAFALDTEGVDNSNELGELATLLHQQLKMKKILSVLPNCSLALNFQIKETLQMGVPFIAILNKTTLENGIFKLMNSCTMLKEQVHVADFNKYAAVLCSGK